MAGVSAPCEGPADQARCAGQARPARRAVCGHCALPLPACLCRHIRPSANRWPVLLLQHPQEAAQAKGSARLLRLGLAHCRLEVGERFDDAQLRAWLYAQTPPPGQAAPLLLYPDPGHVGGPVPAAPASRSASSAGAAALPGIPGSAGSPASPAWFAWPTSPTPPTSPTLPTLAALPCSPPPSDWPAEAASSWPGSPLLGAAPRTLVLLDGSWRQARRLLQANPLLQLLPRWALPPPPPSRYLIRKAHRPQQRSTLEAACLALGALEGRPAFYAPMLAGFDAWVVDLAARSS